MFAIEQPLYFVKLLKQLYEVFYVANMQHKKHRRNS